MMKIKKLAKLLGLCCLTAGLALPSAAQAATGDNDHVTATSVLAEKAGQKPAVTETKAAQQIEAAAKADTSAGQSVDIRSVRLVWDHVPGAVKYQVEILGSAEDTLTNVIMTQNQIFANGVDIEVGRYGKAAAADVWHTEPDGTARDVGLRRDGLCGGVPCLLVDTDAGREAP